MKNILIGGALGLALLAGGVAIAQPEVRGMKADANNDRAISRAELTAQLDKRFARLDADSDGRITTEERAAHAKDRAGKRFARLDTDGNGSISRAEFDAMHDRRMERREMHGGKRGGGRALRGLIDQNSDGVVTKEEFAARAITRFERVDANKDGQVTREERQAAREARRMR